MCVVDPALTTYECSREFSNKIFLCVGFPVDKVLIGKSVEPGTVTGCMAQLMEVSGVVMLTADEVLHPRQLDAVCPRYVVSTVTSEVHRHTHRTISQDVLWLMDDLVEYDLLWRIYQLVNTVHLVELGTDIPLFTSAVVHKEVLDQWRVSLTLFDLMPEGPGLIPREPLVASVMLGCNKREQDLIYTPVVGAIGIALRLATPGHLPR